jgi:hypothetical protein
MRPRGHQRGVRDIPGAVVLDICLCPETVKTGGSGLGNRTVRFGGHRELVPASVLASAFASGTSFYSAATSSGLFFVSGFASPLAEDSLLNPAFS